MTYETSALYVWVGVLRREHRKYSNWKSSHHVSSNRYINITPIRSNPHRWS